MVICTGVGCGTSVIVGKYIGKISGWRDSDIWETDKPIPYYSNWSGAQVMGYENHCPEKNLMRIDGLKEKQEKRETVKA